MSLAKTGGESEIFSPVGAGRRFGNGTSAVRQAWPRRVQNSEDGIDSLLRDETVRGVLAARNAEQIVSLANHTVLARTGRRRLGVGMNQGAHTGSRCDNVRL